MSQQANQTSSQPAGQPANQPTDHPPKKNRHVSRWIALASAATAIIAALISWNQVRIASQQNTETEQAQLESIATAIAQQNLALNEPASPSTAPATLQADDAELTVEAGTGAVLIRELNGNGVAGIEYVEVGWALDYTGAIADAMTYYKDALNAPPPDTPIQAEALRYLGFAYYGVGQSVTGHYYFMQATKAFGKHPLANQTFVANAIAQGYLEDAEAYRDNAGSQISINGCRLIAADLAAARGVMRSYAANPVTQSDQANDSQAYSSSCNGAG
jgi:hypothetical protein